MNEKVFADEFQKGFLRENDFLSFLEEREKNAGWTRDKSKNLRFYAMEEGDELTSKLEERMKANGKEQVFLDTMEHTRLFLKVKDLYYPVRSCAVRTILDRARVSGNALNKVEKAVLAKILNYCMEVASGEALLRFCEDKISAVHGGGASDYAVLEMPELFRRTAEYLRENFKGYIFAGANYDHSIATALWLLEGDDSILCEYRKMLEEHGIAHGNIQLGLRLTTSDSGVSGANLHPILFFDSHLKNIPLGSPLKLEHKNKADMARFDEQLNMLYAHYSTAIGGLQRLLNVEIKHPVDAMIRVMKRIGIPKKYGMEAVEEFKKNNYSMRCTAYEIYVAIAEVLSYLSYEGPCSSEIVRLEENVARAVTIRWSDYDIPEAIW